MMVYYLINTLVAMGIGLAPGEPGPARPRGRADRPRPTRAAPPPKKTRDRPPGRAGPPQRRRGFRAEQPGAARLADAGAGDRPGQDPQRAAAPGETTYRVVVDLLNLGFELLMRVLLWVVALVPLAVLGVVASSVGQKEGIRVFQSLIWLIVVVLAGLACQVAWYLAIMAVFGRMSPLTVPPGRARRHGQHVQHGEHRGDDPDHPRTLSPAAGRLARVEPARGVHRHELQQRRDRPLSGDRRPVHGPGVRLRAGADRPGDHRR